MLKKNKKIKKKGQNEITPLIFGLVAITPIVVLILPYD